MDPFKSLRTVALRDVLLEPPEYHLRMVRRWYSKTFFVPLPDVELMPETEIFQAFYEEKYENLKKGAKDHPEDAEALETELDLLLETEEETMTRSMREEELKYENRVFDQQVDAQAAAQQHAEVEKRAKQQAKALDGSVPRPAKQADILDGLPAAPPKILPSIKMKFAVEEDFQRLLDEDSAGNLGSVPSTRK